MPVISLLPGRSSRRRFCTTEDLLLVLVLVLVHGCGSGAGYPGDVDTETGTDLLDVAPDLSQDPVEELQDTPSADPSMDEAEEVVVEVPIGGPLYESVGFYETTITANDDAADVFHPAPFDLADGGYAFPIALLLQGADVEAEYYGTFATVMASYGFVVVIPDHDIISMAGPGLYAEQSEVHDVLAHMRSEFEDGSSPVHGVLDINTIVIVGHSYGGVAGVNAIRGACEMPTCMGGFTRPAELKGGAFWGTNLAMPLVGTIPDIDNSAIPIALIQGTLDGMAIPTDGQGTYDHIQDPPKVYVEIEGANHYGICSANNPPGADADTSAPALDQLLGITTIARWSSLFLRAHVLGDAEALEYVHTSGDDLDDVATVVARDPGG